MKKVRSIDGPTGAFAIPAEPDDTSRHAEACARGVFAGEYSYPRQSVEDDVHTLVDVGHNLGALVAWACGAWWPGGRIRRVFAYEPNRDAVEIAHFNVDARLWQPEGQPGEPPLYALTRAAVTSAREARLTRETNWGARHMAGPGEQDTDPVPVVHPALLPAADVLKIDCEGAGADVARNYQHWDQVKVCMYESHNAEERDVLEACCRLAKLEMVRGNPERPEGDVRVWRRRT